MSGPGAKSYIAINNFLIDCSISESHSFDSEVTDYPVESGSSIADNIRPLPIQVDIEGLVSNTPIGLMRDERSSADTRPAEDAYELFQSIRKAREPVTIQTSLRTFDSMVLQSLTIPKGDHMDHLRFQAKFKQIITVENKRTIRVSTPIGTGKKKVGKPADPYGGRTILIDRLLNRWWDPDYVTWRANVIYRQTRQDLTGSTTITPRWHLYRGLMFPDTIPAGLIGVSDLDPETSNINLTEGDSDSWRKVFKKPFRQLINVPVAQCVLEGFTIKKAPGTEPEHSRSISRRSL